VLKVLELSPYQDFFWKAWLVTPQSDALVLKYCFHMSGEVDVFKLKKFIRTYLDDLSLKINLHMSPDSIQAKNLPDDFFFKAKNLRAAKQISMRELSKVNSTQEPFSKIILIEITPTEYVFAFAFSHLIFDGVSYVKFCKAIEGFYNNAVSFDDKQVLPVVTHEKSFAPIVNNEDELFWVETCKGKSIKQKLRFFKNAPPNISPSFLREKIILSQEEMECIISCINTHQTTNFHLISATLSTLIFKYNQSPETELISLGHSVNIDYAKNKIGCFTNFIPLWVSVSDAMTPQELMITVKEQREKVKKHQHLPLARILNNFGPEEARFFNVFINESPALINVRPPYLDGIKVDVLDHSKTNGSYDIGVHYHASEKDFHIEIAINQDISSRAQIKEIAYNFKKTLLFLCQKSDRAIGSLRLDAKQTSLEGARIKTLNQTNLAENILSRMIKNRNKVGIVFLDTELTYEEIVHKTYMLVEHIKNKYSSLGLNQQIIVGIHLKRSENIPIAILSSIFGNFCFVALDPYYPLDRLNYMIKTAKVSCIITDLETHAQSGLSENKNISWVFLDQITTSSLIPINEISFNNFVDNTYDPLYVLFTSGSTGNPKGVVISNQNLFNFLLSMEKISFFNENDYLIAMTSLNFDISLLEFLLPIFVGGRLEVLTDEEAFNAEKIINKIEKSPVTFVQATPSMWKMLYASNWSSLKRIKVLTGGEALDETLAHRLLNSGHTVFNMYGPTETTIWSSCFQVNDARAISIGFPIGNTEFHILDETLQPCLLGTLGNLWISGDGVGEGYLNAKNEDVFQFFGKRKAYKTGDLVRNYGDGIVKYIGRSDTQVKIKGFRVELSEISNLIKSVISCLDVVVLLKEIPEPHLVAFLLQGQGIPLSSEEIFATLSLKLPHYMIPDQFYWLKEFPLTPNKKVDYTLLKKIDPSIILDQMGFKDSSYKKNVNKLSESTKRRLMKVFSEHNIHLPDKDHAKPFGLFGLHSIAFNQLSSSLKEIFKVNIEPHDFYLHNTFDKLADFLNEKFIPEGIVDAQLNHEPLDDFAGEKDSVVKVAIVGVSGTLPQAASLNIFWQNLINKKSAITKSHRKTLSDGFAAGFLDHIEEFDPEFFHISPLEAMQIDPQQRLLLQNAWNVIEDSGYNIRDLENQKTGVYIAVTGNDYYSIQRQDPKFNPIPYTMSGFASSILANRISYVFNFNGPSETIDTACSGSLIALIKSCEDLISGKTDFGLVGSANIILDHKINEALDAGQFLSPKNRCATFDEGADGYVRGEGVGCVLLRRLEDAQRNNDHIYGVIVSGAENHGGRAHSLTAPNPEAQKNLLIQAYQTPELARQVSYIEAHGTGTKLGDPIEIDALKMAWQHLGAWDETPYIGLGSVKSHIGHLEPAAGIASLLKVILCLKHRMLPGNLHFKTLNPYIKIDKTPFYIVDHTQPWVSHTGPLTAGISSFGFGGSNAHIVVQEAPQRSVRKGPIKPAYLLCLSAKNKGSLETLVHSIKEFLILRHDDPLYTLENIIYTLNTGRSHFEFRITYLVNSLEELLEHLSRPLPDTLADVTIRQETIQDSLVSWTDETRYRHQLSKWSDAYIAGYELPWLSLHQGESQSKLPLPTYPFNTQPYWFEQAADSSLIQEVLHD
jgi:amino acid adenylation domain-containing protein